MFDARDIVGRVKRQAQNGVVLLKPQDFYVDASIRSSIFSYGTRPARLRQIPARFCEAHRDDRLAFRECGLTLHPEKTKIVYCKDEDRPRNHLNQTFDFLGYTFRPRLSRRKAGRVGVSLSPAISAKARKKIGHAVRGWALHLRSDKSLEDLARG